MDSKIAATTDLFFALLLKPSPLPVIINCSIPNSYPILNRDWPDTREERILVKSPSSVWGNLIYKDSAMISPSIESPKNSNLS